MKRDLEREMRKIAVHLDIEIDEKVFCDLVKAAGFGAMKAQVDSLFPGADAKLWKSNAQFFAKGINGQWKERWSSENMGRFEALCSTDVSDYVGLLLLKAD